MYRIEISDLVLRPVQKSDAQRMVDLVNDITLARNTSRIPFPYTFSHAKEFVERAISDEASDIEHRFAVCRGRDIIACTGVRRMDKNIYELGYWVGAGYRGEGVAKKAAAAVTAFAFRELNAIAVTAGHFVDNPASARVLRHIGFHATGDVIETFSLARGHNVDTARFRVERNQLKLPDKIAIRKSGD